MKLGMRDNQGWIACSRCFFVQAWRKRFFKLRSSKVLEYYKSEDGDIQKGVINLEDCVAVHSNLAHKKYSFVFDVETKFRVYYLVAQTQPEMKTWVDELCRVCGLCVDSKWKALSLSQWLSLSLSSCVLRVTKK